MIGLEPEIKDLTIEIRKSHYVKLPDAVILATAQFLNIPLITSDKKLLVKDNNLVIFYKTKL